MPMGACIPGKSGVLGDGIISHPFAKVSLGTSGIPFQDREKPDVNNALKQGTERGELSSDIRKSWMVMS